MGGDRYHRLHIPATDLFRMSYLFLFLFIVATGWMIGYLFPAGAAIFSSLIYGLWDPTETRSEWVRKGRGGPPEHEYKCWGKEYVEQYPHSSMHISDQAQERFICLLSVFSSVPVLWTPWGKYSSDRTFSEKWKHRMIKKRRKRSFSGSLYPEKGDPVSLILRIVRNLIARKSKGEA